MRLAFHYGAREDFDRIWEWTQQNLYVRDDELAAWRWVPGSDPHVGDRNNATDGDLFIAWSLSLAGRCWAHEEYIESARRISRDIRDKLIRETSAGLLLLPGSEGFVQGTGLTLNPSYWVFPALGELAVLEPDVQEWPALVDDGYELVEKLRFGRWNLVPDWADWSPKSGFGLSGKFAPRFGYDAIRVPLYQVWHGRDGAILGRLAKFWEGQSGWSWRPDWVDLETQAVSSYSAPPGIEAISNLTRFAAASAGRGGSSLFLALPSPSLQEAGSTDYYSASLMLFSRIAARRWCQQHDCAIDGL
jgi:endoglucanase